MNKEGLENKYQPSRLFLYYFTRFLEDTVEEDSGANLKDLMKTVMVFGCPSEEDLPYDITKFTEKPPLEIVKKAREHLDNFDYFSVKQDLNVMKQVLADGFPIIIGIVLFESFFYDETMKTGIVPIPKVTESISGGHAILIVKYDDDTNCFTIQNSWGSDVGQSGYFDIPYEYILNENLGQDYWHLRKFK
jgi:C1A family cysteine protease